MLSLLTGVRHVSLCRWGVVGCFFVTSGFVVFGCFGEAGAFASARSAAGRRTASIRLRRERAFDIARQEPPAGV